MSKEQQSCAIRNGNLTSDTGLSADAQWYPHARICRGACTLQGRDLNVNDFGSGVTVTVKKETGRESGVGCAMVKTQQRRR